MTVNQVRPSVAWPPDDVDRLLKAYRRGGERAAIAAFPDRTRGAVRSAVRRFTWDGAGFDCRTPFARSPEDVRSALDAMPIDLFVDRIAELMPRRSDYRGVR
jgi:hypothetical protein